MLNAGILNLFKSCMTITVTIYGLWFMVTEVFYSFIPLGILLTCLLAAVLHTFRIPAPPANAVEAIVGKDLREENSANSGAYFMKTVAHRGAGLDAPENSLVAFKLCSEANCDFIEFDVRLTADDVPIVFHDETLERMTDLNYKINDYKWDVLKKVDISIKDPFKDRFKNTTIPTLNATVEQLLGCGQRMIIDIKDNNKKIVNIILQLFEKYPELQTRALVSSFYPNIIYLIRRSNPNIVCALAHRPYFFAYSSYNTFIGIGERRAAAFYKHYCLLLLDLVYNWLLSNIIYFVTGLSLILLHKDIISAKTVTDWHSKGVRVVAWTVNYPTEKQHFARDLKITYLTDTLIGESTTHFPTN